jgi:hypothetical protein
MPGVNNKNEGDDNRDRDGGDACGRSTVQHERDTIGLSPGGTTVGHVQRVCEA